jgi:hypothetical protein
MQSGTTTNFSGSYQIYRQSYSKQDRKTNTRLELFWCSLLLGAELKAIRMKIIYTSDE